MRSAAILAASIALAVSQEVNHRAVGRDAKPLGPSELRAPRRADPGLTVAATASCIADLAEKNAIAEPQHRTDEGIRWGNSVDPKAQVSNRLTGAFRLAATRADCADGGKAQQAGLHGHGFECAAHRVKIPPMRRSPLHRLTACLVALCFALFSGEAAVADVHDAHGSAPALTEQGDGTRLPAAPGSHGTQQPDSPGESGHPIHVCHCTHAHTAGSIVGHAAVSAPPIQFRALDIAASQYAPNRVQEPPVRPPIA